MDFLCYMSVIRTYSVKDLAVTTEDLMNTLYKTEWKGDIDSTDEDFLFSQIETMHSKIMSDSEITQYNAGSSKLISIANRLFAIENSLIGSAVPVAETVTVRTCILRTQSLIRELSTTDTRFCVVC